MNSSVLLIVPTKNASQRAEHGMLFLHYILMLILPTFHDGELQIFRDAGQQAERTIK
jgi:hypothetical protein